MIYKKGDLASYKIGDLTVHFSPLTFGQKTKITAMMSNGKDIEQILIATKLALQYSLKKIEGLDEDFELTFDSKGNVDDDSIDVILNATFSQDLNLIASNLINHPPEKFMNEDGTENELIKFVGKIQAGK